VYASAAKLTDAVEAIRMVERGDATPQDIDQAMQLGAGYREFGSNTS
jgi:3-hydroxyacyl-CoA dehydrogenase